MELWMQLAFYLLTVPSRFYFNVLSEERESESCSVMSDSL